MIVAFVIILVTVVSVYADLAFVVVIQVIVSVLVYVWNNVRHIPTKVLHYADGAKDYKIQGLLFFRFSDGFWNYLIWG